MTGLSALTFIVLVIGFMVGIVKPRRLGRWFFWAVFGPVITAVLLVGVRQLYSQLSPVAAVVLIGLGILAVAIAAMRFLLPRDIFAHLMANILYDFLKTLAGLPSRMFRWCREAWRNSS